MDGGTVWPPRVHHAPPNVSQASVYINHKEHQEVSGFNRMSNLQDMSKSGVHGLSWKKTTNLEARKQILCGVLKISNWWLVTTHHTHPSKWMVALSDLLGFIMQRPTFQRHLCTANTTNSKKSLASTQCQICRTCQNQACMINPARYSESRSKKTNSVWRSQDLQLVISHHTPYPSV